MAGPRTHVEMGAILCEERLTAGPDVPVELADLLRFPVNRSAFYCGCMFPDWGYNGIHDDAAEDSHWPPFQQALLGDFQRQHALPWNDEARRLLAFCLGVVVHGVTDDLWHFSRGDRQCFLEVAKGHDGAEHGPCEMACDVFTHVECPRRPMHGRFWWPTDVILRVYAQREITVTPAQLAAGFRKLEREWHMGARWGWLAYPYFRVKYPWCHQNYRGAHHGAIAHGAAAAARRIREVYAQLRSNA